MMQALICMEFGDKWDSFYFEELKPLFKGIGINCRRADEIFPGFKQIPTAIFDEIRKTDLIIIELSTLNKNVLMEIGFAKALQKPIIVLCEDSKINDLPFMLRSQHVVHYSDNNRKLLYKTLRKAISSVRGDRGIEFESAETYGHVEINKSRPHDNEKIARLLRETEKTADMLFISAANTLQNQLTVIEPALRRGVKFRLLILDESSLYKPIVSQLCFGAISSMDDSFRIATEIILNLPQDVFSVRMYNDFPLYQAIILDSQCIWYHPTMHTFESHGYWPSFTLQPPNDSPYLRKMIDHYDDLWNKGTIYTRSI